MFVCLDLFAEVTSYLSVSEKCKLFLCSRALYNRHSRFCLSRYPFAERFSFHKLRDFVSSPLFVGVRRLLFDDSLGDLGDLVKFRSCLGGLTHLELSGSMKEPLGVDVLPSSLQCLFLPVGYPLQEMECIIPSGCHVQV
jgi:hypothetical protein